MDVVITLISILCLIVLIVCLLTYKDKFRIIACSIAIYSIGIMLGNVVGGIRRDFFWAKRILLEQPLPMTANHQEHPDGTRTIEFQRHFYWSEKENEYKNRN